LASSLNVVLALPRGTPVAAAIPPAVFGPSLSASGILARVWPRGRLRWFRSSTAACSSRCQRGQAISSSTRSATCCSTASGST